ncbi:MAG: hypothetical protein EBZ77_05105 [Chitinophagia bacterium]|nr:hypothetical protein [Chitinophagia bacterium]
MGIYQGIELLISHASGVYATVNVAIGAVGTACVAGSITGCSIVFTTTTTCRRTNSIVARTASLGLIGGIGTTFCTC